VTAEINHVLRRQPVTRHYECVSAIRITLCDELFRSRTLAEPPFGISRPTAPVIADAVPNVAFCRLGERLLISERYFCVVQL
jgi:hypothetical protein